MGKGRMQGVNNLRAFCRGTHALELKHNKSLLQSDFSKSSITSALPPPTISLNFSTISIGRAQDPSARTAVSRRRTFIALLSLALYDKGVPPCLVCKINNVVHSHTRRAFLACPRDLIRFGVGEHGIVWKDIESWHRSCLDQERSMHRPFHWSLQNRHAIWSSQDTGSLGFGDSRCSLSSMFSTSSCKRAGIY